MFVVNDDKSIYLTRGDIAVLRVSAENIDGSIYTFGEGDVVRLKVFEKKNHENIILQKDSSADEGAEYVDIPLTKEDTEIGKIINKPVDYWYEIELNPDTASQTIVGYDIDGPKIFRLFPEGGDKE